MTTEMSGPETAPPTGPPGLAPYVRPPKNPALAVFLSLFPGLGQVYNGQPAKAFVFFFSWVGSIYGAAFVNPFPFGFLIPFVYLYNLIDAYRSAVLFNNHHAGGKELPEETGRESPAWGGSLVLIGLLLLAHNLHWLDLVSLERFWPIVLIAAGGAFIYASIQKGRGTEGGDGGQI